MRFSRWFILSTLIVCFAACSSRQTVVVYSPHGPDMLRDYEELFEAAYPEIDVQALDMGSQDVYTRVRAEKNRPAADVWWGGPSTMFMQAAEEGLLEAYKPSWANAVPSAYKDPNHRWYGVFSSPLAIVYNTRHYERNDMPQTWDELLHPKWDGKITIRKPMASGTMRTFIGATFLRKDSEDAAIDYLRTLHTMTETYVESPQLLYDHIKRKEELISVWLLPDIILQREQNDYPFGFVIPPKTAVLTEGIAIINDAPHPELARKFYEFVTTKEALAQQALAYGKVPTRTDINRASLPDWLEGQKIDPLGIDWKHFAKKEQYWVDRWRDEIYSGQTAGR